MAQTKHDDTKAESESNAEFVKLTDGTDTALVTAAGSQNVLDDNSAAIKTAVEIIDNFISGARGLVTEDNSSAIKTAVEVIDNFISGSRGLVTEDNSASIKTAVEAVNTALQTAGITQVQLAAIKTAVETIDNFISGSRGLVTEDNSSAIKTAVEVIDNFISGSRGLVTEDSASAIKTAVEAINTALQSAGITQTQLAAIKAAVEIIDNFISGSRGLVTEDNSASIKTAVELIDNFISGARGLVTEDNSLAIKTAVEIIDNFISGSRGLVTEDNSASIKTAVEAHNTKINTEITADYDTGAGTQTMKMIGVALPASGGAVAGGTAINPIRTDPTGTTTQPVSGTVTANLGTIADVATQTTLALIKAKTDNLDTALSGVKTGTDKIPSQGQALMAASTPVAIASNQSAVPVSGTVTANLGTIADVATQTTLALIKAKTDNIDVAASTLAKESTQLLQPVAATTPTLYNVTMTLANTEYSQALPTNTKILEFRCRSTGYDVRFAFETGKVAGSVSPFRTLGSGEVKTLDNLNLTGKTLYVACSTAAQVMEIEVWS